MAANSEPTITVVLAPAIRPDPRGRVRRRLLAKVLDAYRFLVQNFDPGDQIFFFGFSRGEFPARSTAGLVRNAGIVRRENADKLEHPSRRGISGVGDRREARVVPPYPVLDDSVSAD